MNDLQERPRLLFPALARALKVMPVVVVTGARQTGKSTLVQAQRSRPYVSLDDLDVLRRARDEPAALVGSHEQVTIDEVQRHPDLLLAVKRAVDGKRRAGAFILTGSANLLLLKGVSETLTGRAAWLRLHVMTRREQAGLAAAGAWSELLAAPDAKWPALVGRSPAVAEDWRGLARRGGYPVPALHLSTDDERAIWFQGYLQSWLERDVRDLANISSLVDFRRLAQAACLRLGGLVNQTDLARDVGLSQPTAHRWLGLLEASCHLVRLPAFAVNRTKRLIKSPKLYWSDVGLALHLAGVPEPGGEHLENLVLLDLLAWASGMDVNPAITYWRTASGDEVDFVIEAQRQLLPVEVKATVRPRLEDARGLRAFLSEHGRASRAGLLLHCGEATTWLTDRVLAVPWWRIL